jgi:hypothetical protein
MVEKSSCVIRAMVESRGAMKLRASISLGVFVAFVAALTLASSPQLHEQLHQVNSQHQCAATLVASGSYHHAAPPVLAATALSPSTPAFTPENSELVLATASSSVLEHAPPSAV